MSDLKPSKWLGLFQNFVQDIRIVSKEEISDDKRGIPLKLLESQKRFVREIGMGLDHDIHRFLCLKSRQLGITTVSLAIDVFWIAIHDNITAAMVTDNEANREANRALITKYVNSFEPGYFGSEFRIVASNREMMQFSNGATLRFLVAGTKKKSISWAEGTGYALIHCTEVAKYANPDGLKSLLEGFAQFNPHRLLIMESTANGWNFWKTMWEAGASDPFTQSSFFIGWWANAFNTVPVNDPRYTVYGRFGPTKEERNKIAAVKQFYEWSIAPEQLAWIRWKESDAGREQDLLQQNQPWTAQEAFVESGYSFFTTRDINKDLHERDRSLKEDEHSPYHFKGYRYLTADDIFDLRLERLYPENGDPVELVELKIWEEPAAKGKYVLGFDVAYGRNDHKDANAITVWRCYSDKLVQVAEYVTYGVDVKYAAWAFFHLTAAYGDVMGNIEVGGPGEIVFKEFDHLRQLISADHNYARVKARQWEDAAANACWYLYHRADSLGAGYVKGFQTHMGTKPKLMHNVRSCYATHNLVIRSRRLLNEMLQVIVDADGSIGAPESSDTECKDDLVFSMAFAALAWTDWVRPGLLAENKTYENVTKEERGEVKPESRMINGLVSRFLAAANEERVPEPTWRERNGLV